jgi:LuxR family maltose regulon positive regulatory protein
MPLPIVGTKITVPPLREDRVLRSQLVEQLNAGLNRKVTLICSPAGFGKTTLLCELATSSDRPVVWVTLDEEDNDSTRFMAYLMAAMSTVKQGFGESLYPALQTPKPERMNTLLAALINEISAELPPFILVLDDYHLITNPAIHEQLIYIIDHQSQQMHIMMSTRADPPLPISRLRARAQLSEIREKDLRFTDQEVEEFLNQVMNLNLADDELAAMGRRTEGWAAGLQLAAISLQDQSDKGNFVKTFAGSNRYILDYLGQEVLDNQDQEIREFLLKTSIPDQLNAKLGEFLTGAQDSQEILERLERDHLFIQPLDQERGWYRYHQLFRDFLLKSLQQSQPEHIVILHKKASLWFEAEGLIDEAIEHALSAEDHQRSSKLIEKTAEARLMRSEASSIIRWINKLPAGELESRPSLCLTLAWALMLRGGPVDEIESTLNLVESADTDDQMRGSAAAIQAFLAAIKGDAKASLELSEHALELISAENLFLRSLVTDNLGMVYLMRGDFDASVKIFNQAAQISRQAGNVMIAVGALCNMAGIWMLQGQLKRAWSANMEALAIATDKRGRRLPVAGKALLGLGEIAREWNQLESAERYLREGLELFRLYGELGSVLSYVSLARIKEIHGDLDGAQDVVDLARKLAIQFDASSLDDELVDAYQAQLWLQMGKHQQALRWVAEQKLEDVLARKIDESRFDPIWEIYSQTLARVYISQGRCDEALHVIEPLLNVAKANQRIKSVLKILALQVVILKSMGKDQLALQILEQALYLAEEEGFVRTFLDEGEPMVQMLYQAAVQGILPEYTGQLLAENATLQPSSISQKGESTGRMELVEPLSEREVEVLELIAEGLSNQEIANRLHISLSTVKGHNSNIYGKLAVNKRTQAVARAKELGIFRGN